MRLRWQVFWASAVAAIQPGLVRITIDQSIGREKVQAHMSFAAPLVAVANLPPTLKEAISHDGVINTDEAIVYYMMRDEFAGRDAIQHQAKQCSKVVDERNVTTRMLEGCFSILKRGVNGIHHHVGRQHLHRYLREFDFRYNSRNATDSERAQLAVKGTEGKRLTCRDSFKRAR